MTYTDLKLDQDGEVLKITVDRPELLQEQEPISLPDMI